VLDNVALKVQRGEIVVLLGPSGCGKSTILRAVAGLLHPTSGRMLFGGVEVDGPSCERAMVFQNYACFPFLTVEGNVAFGLMLNGVAIETATQRVDDLLEMVNLKHLRTNYPTMLSGGERQRVAIARSLALKPQLLSMDEPFSSLDGTMRRHLQDMLLSLKDGRELTCLFVTHSVEEAVYLGSRIYLMSAGPTDAKRSPATILDEVMVTFSAPRTQAIKMSREFEDIERKVNEMIRKRAYAND
jgi:ABC-type nitrate/sulfonate/bicarbonate transport system ATPase subunit